VRRGATYPNWVIATEGLLFYFAVNGATVNLDTGFQLTYVTSATSVSFTATYSGNNWWVVVCC
jgi:hypothetical protein